MFAAATYAKLREMPEEPIEGLKWVTDQLLKDLAEAKMWPVKMNAMKHQEALSAFTCNQTTITTG